MKLIGVIAIVCCSAFVGRRLAHKYSLRQRAYVCLISFCTAYRSNLTYEKKSLQNLVDRTDNELFRELYKRAQQNKGAPDYLNKEEFNYIRDFFGNLGRGDVESSMQQSEFYLAHFKENHNVAMQENKQKSSLLKKLGVFGGLLMSILVL